MFPNNVFGMGSNTGMPGHMAPGVFPGMDVPSNMPGPSFFGGSQHADGSGGGGFPKKGMCNKFMQTGSCSWGDACKYSHGQAPKDSFPDRGAGFNASAGPNSAQYGGPAVAVKMKKTKLCDKFMSSGFCPYRDKCMFAHGMEDLRNGDTEMQGNAAGMPSMPGPPGGMPGTMPQIDPFRPGSGLMQMSKAPAPMSHSMPPPGARPPPPSVPQGSAQGTHVPAAAGAPAVLAISSSPMKEVTFIDKVRAVCSILSIGNAAALTKDKPAALQAAVTAIKNGTAFRQTPFADDVEQYINAKAELQ